MTKKSKRDTGAANLTCSICGTKAHSITGKPHRRCSGQSGNPVKQKYDIRLAKSERGKWQ